MKKCNVCNDFIVKSINSYAAHLGLKHSGISLAKVDLEYLNEKWESISFRLKRQVLLEESNAACSECGYNKTRKCGSSILEIDHINGNNKDNSKNNLRVLCPNCHALTGTYRNWGNDGNKKTSRRFRKGNVNYREVISEKKSSHRIAKEAFEQIFIEKVLELYENNVIDFGKFGWIQKLCIHFDEAPQVTGKRIKRLMPDFYDEKCFRRNHNKYKNHADVA